LVTGHEKNSRGFKFGDIGEQATGPSRQIQLPGNVLQEEIKVEALWLSGTKFNITVL
jgi:hypothetical protein